MHPDFTCRATSDPGLSVDLAFDMEFFRDRALLAVGAVDAAEKSYATRVVEHYAAGASLLSPTSPAIEAAGEGVRTHARIAGQELESYQEAVRELALWSVCGIYPES